MDTEGKSIIGVKKSEKTVLITIFCLFFLLSSILIFVMIKKDVQEKELQESRMLTPQNSAPDNVWPKVEIQTRQ